LLLYTELSRLITWFRTRVFFSVSIKTSRVAARAQVRQSVGLAWRASCIAPHLAGVSRATAGRVVTKFHLLGDPMALFTALFTTLLVTSLYFTAPRVWIILWAPDRMSLTFGKKALSLSVCERAAFSCARHLSLIEFRPSRRYANVLLLHLWAFHKDLFNFCPYCWSFLLLGTAEFCWFSTFLWLIMLAWVFNINFAAPTRF